MGRGGGLLDGLFEEGTDKGSVVWHSRVNIKGEVDLEVLGTQEPSGRLGPPLDLCLRAQVEAHVDSETEAAASKARGQETGSPRVILIMRSKLTTARRRTASGTVTWGSRS